MLTLLESLLGHDLSKSDKNHALVTKKLGIEVDSLKKKRDTTLRTLHNVPLKQSKDVHLHVAN